MNKNKILLGAIIIVILALLGVLLWQNYFQKDESVPLPPEENTNVAQSFEGKFYKTPEGAEYDDYFVDKEGKEYGVTGKNQGIETQIEELRDSGKTVTIRGLLSAGVKDYGERQIVIEEISEKESVDVGMANPASVYCEAQGGVLDIRDTDKGQIGICVFQDKKECEEWAYFRGECDPKEGNIVLKSCDEFSREFKKEAACLQTYQPVCARVLSESDDPLWKTYSNGCVACTAFEYPVVYGYEEGVCE